MTLNELKKVIIGASMRVLEQADEFSRIDAETGDGDHGVTMAKICEEIIRSTKEPADETVGEYFDRISMDVMTVNGGSAGSLWAMMLEGVGEELEGVVEIDKNAVAKMFSGAASGIMSASTAKEGEKTMLDALLPAVRAAGTSQGSVKETLAEAAGAAEKGAENTRNMIAKFGRAKNLQENSIGYLDAGAVSMAAMIRAISDEANKN